MKKIVFGITNLNLGGAERVLVDICNKLSNIYDITIFTIYGKGDFEKELSPKIHLNSIYKNSYEEKSHIAKKIIPLKIFFMQKQIYNKYIKNKYDVEIAFLEGPITKIFSTKNKDTKKIAWVHNDISKVFGNGIKAKIKKYINKNLYSKFSKLIFVSKDNLEKFNDYYSLNVKKELIYNYIDMEKIIKKAEENIDYKFDESCINLLSVARLVEQKGIDRIINVHKRLIQDGYYHKFYIIGDGPLKEKLIKLIEQKDVKDTFILLGKKENPYPYIKNANYFCLLSYYEGYGMVIEEAKILNKPIIITDTAAREAVNRIQLCYYFRKYRTRNI